MSDYERLRMRLSRLTAESVSIRAERDGVPEGDHKRGLGIRLENIQNESDSIEFTLQCAERNKRAA